MKIQFAQSTREHEVISFTEFKVIQDNRSKTVTLVTYQSANGPREMAFMNKIEAVLNNRGRYVQAQSNRDYCARILPEPEPEETEEVAEAA
jgi:hypothetical protein